MRIWIALIAAAPVLAGCTSTLEAYWHKPTKYKEMPDKQRDPYVPVATLSLDATRRLVISQLTPANQQTSRPDRNASSASAPSAGQRFTCPEPPPDVALNTLSQALLSLKTKGGLDTSAGSAYQTIVQALHARTSTVEFWRTTSSMYCVLLMNGATTAADKYLEAAEKSIAVTHDTVVTTPAAAAFIDGLIAAAEKKVADDKAAQEAAAKKKKDDEEAALAAAKKKCDAVPEAEKKDNADCKKAGVVKAG